MSEHEYPVRSILSVPYESSSQLGGLESESIVRFEPDSEHTLQIRYMLNSMGVDQENIDRVFTHDLTSVSLYGPQREMVSGVAAADIRDTNLVITNLHVNPYRQGRGHRAAGLLSNLIETANRFETPPEFLQITVTWQESKFIRGVLKKLGEEGLTADKYRRQIEEHPAHGKLYTYTQKIK